MKFSLAAVFLASVAVATPVVVTEHPVLETNIIEQQDNIVARQEAKAITEHEYSIYGCRDVIFFFARGTTELGNLGLLVGSPLSDALKDEFGTFGVASEGIDYPALIGGNFLPGGADLGGVADMADLLEDAATNCPTSKIVAGGYSQGAALTHGAIKNLSEAVKARIAGVVTFGDTRNLQDGGQIPNFDEDKTLIICNLGDSVCLGNLIILPAHLTYGTRVGEAADFLIERINAAI